MAAVRRNVGHDAISPAPHVDSSGRLSRYGVIPLLNRYPTIVPSRAAEVGVDRFAIVAMTMLGVIFGAAAVMGIAPAPGDAEVYWLNQPGTYEANVYVYPPVLSQLLVPLRDLGAVQPFVVAWEALCFASVGYVLGRWAFVCLAFVPVALVVPQLEPLASPITASLMGNVTMPMVAAMVLGMRRPGWWAVPILTKITPGVGVLWFAFRGEWRRLALALGVTVGIVAVSFALDPAAWTTFVTFAVSNAGSDVNGPPIVGPPLSVRLVAAVLLLAWGARTNRPWVVPVAAAMSLVGLYGLSSLIPIAVAVRRTRP